MITKECNTESTCLICASEYHMELILLPFLKSKMDTKKIVIFTEKDIKKTIYILLDKINIKNEEKDRFKTIDWSRNDEKKLKILEQYQANDEKVLVILNGMKKYIDYIKNNIKEKRNIETVECFYIYDSDVDFENIRDKYSKILNTKKL